MTQHGDENRKTRRPLNTRSDNLKLLFDLINSGQELTRADLVRMTGMSPSTVSSLTQTLARENLVEDMGLARPAGGAGGRRPMMLRIREDGRQIPVFSLGSGGVCYTLYDLAYNVLERHFAAGAPAGDGQAYPDIIGDILSHHAQRLDAGRAVGLLISYPGAYIPEEDKYLLTSLGTSFPRQALDRLSRAAGLRVYMGNSSMSLAYAEKKQLDAEGAPVDNLIYINVCDGLGAGIINNGDALSSDERIAGELGHITVVPGGRVCGCGNRGCLERYVNIREIITRTRDALSDGETDGASVPSDGEMLARIGAAYDRGEPRVVQVMDDIAAKLFSGICCMVAVTGIRCVVIGGLEALGTGFLEHLSGLCRGECPGALMRGVRFLYPRVCADADSLGLARYFIDKQYRINE